MRRVVVLALGPVPGRVAGRQDLAADVDDAERPRESPRLRREPLGGDEHAPARAAVHDACFSIIAASRGTAASTFFFALPRSFSYVPLTMPLLERFALSSVMVSSASATRAELRREVVAHAWPARLRLLVEGLEGLRELGQQVGHDLPHEARLDALHGLVARLDGQPREAALVGDLRVDEGQAVVDHGALVALRP